MKNEKSRRCTDADVDPSWWLEPDLDPADFGETATSAGGHRSLDTQYGRALQVARQDQARAKLLCYSCPFLLSCRDAAWDEPAHIFGGLDANERFAARSKGQVPIGSQYVYKSARKSLHRRSEVVGLFVSGSSVGDLAATLGCNTDQIWAHVKGYLATVRANWEDKLWRDVPAPALPEKVSRSSFRLGALISSDWEWRPGATTPPSGQDSSSDSDTRMPRAA